MPRTVAEQFGVGANVDARDIRAGDLMFFDTTGPGSVARRHRDRSPSVRARVRDSGGVVRVDQAFSTRPYWTEIRAVDGDQAA